MNATSGCSCASLGQTVWKMSYCMPPFACVAGVRAHLGLHGLGGIVRCLMCRLTLPRMDTRPLVIRVSPTSMSTGHVSPIALACLLSPADTLKSNNNENRFDPSSRVLCPVPSCTHGNDVVEIAT